MLIGKDEEQKEAIGKGSKQTVIGGSSISWIVVFCSVATDSQVVGFRKEAVQSSVSLSSMAC